MRVMYIVLFLIFCLSAIAALIVGSGFLFPRKDPISSSEMDRYVSVLGSLVRFRVHELSSYSSDKGRSTIVLLHGFGGSLDHWKKIQPLLTHKSIALDLVGFGGSDVPPISYDLDTQWRYLDEFLSEQGLSDVILVGTSMGGSLAAWTAAKSKNRVVGLILIAPSGLPGSLRKNWPFNWLYRPGVTNRIVWTLVNNQFYRRLFPDSLAAHALSVTNSYDTKFEQILGDISQPTLLTWSKGDDTTLYDYHVGYKTRVKNLEFQELPASLNHQVPQADPKGTAVFINEFARRFR